MTKDEESLLSSLTPFSAPGVTLNTAAWFDAAHTPAAQSPIDEFITNLYAINRLYLGAETRGEYSPILGSLVYLGMVSAAESYFRSLIRRLILVDVHCQANASTRLVSYGAALHHEADLLPEALLEGVSLASTRGVASELRNLCGISQMTKDGGVPKALQKLFDNFEAICQIRHCGIHRFGKLGSQQALRLGMDSHAPLLEKPLRLTVRHLQDIAEALEALVRGVNSYCFADVIRRTHTASPAGREKDKYYAEVWQRDAAQDLDRFSKYYAIFACSVGPDSDKSKPMQDVYSAFLAYIKQYDSSAAPKSGASRAASTPASSAPTPAPHIPPRPASVPAAHERTPVPVPTPAPQCASARVGTPKSASIGARIRAFLGSFRRDSR